MSRATGRASRGPAASEEALLRLAAAEDALLGGGELGRNDVARTVWLGLDEQHDDLRGFSADLEPIDAKPQPRFRLYVAVLLLETIG